MAQERKSKGLGRTTRPRRYVRGSEHKRISNRELCRQWVEAYRPDRLDDLLALLHPDIEWITTETWVEREVWCGHAEVAVGLRRFFSEWEEFSNDEIEAFSDGGDKFAVVTRMRGRSRGTHIPTEMRTSGVAEVRDGLIVRVVGHSDPADALAAVAMPATTGRALSRENVELVRRGFDAYQRRDVQGMCDVAHARCEVFTFTVGVVEAEPFRGHAGIADWMAHELEPWEEWRVEPGEVHEVCERVLVRANVTARGQGSNVELTADSGMVFEFRERRIMRVWSYLNWDDALKAVGLRKPPLPEQNA